MANYPLRTCLEMQRARAIPVADWALVLAKTGLGAEYYYYY
jgi:hypothetical protein